MFDAEIRDLERAVAAGDVAAKVRLEIARLRLAGETYEPRPLPERAGSKYDERYSTKDVAAMFRVDVKNAIAAGELPKGLKLSVRTKYFSGGSSIDVDIKAAPGVRILTPEWVAWYATNPTTYNDRIDRYTPEALALRRRLDSMLRAYNYDASRSEVDYFDVNFYSSVDFSGDLENAERAPVAA